MRTFQINEKISVVCDSVKTRYGFRHDARLMLNGSEAGKAKCCYYNRTWESYEYQSVLQKLFEKTQELSADEKKLCKEWANGDHTDWSGFRSVAMVAQLGDLFCQDKKSQNDWKTRMIKAGFGEAISMPEDWESLPEDEKARRLNLVIAQLKESGQKNV